MDSNLVNQLFSQINNLIDYKLSQQTTIKSGVIHSVNQDLTVNIFIPPSNMVYHNIQNQSVYRNLKPGDSVKLLVENGNMSNMWIIGGFNLQLESTDINKIYPVGSIYISINSTDPSSLFGGTWERIKDTFLLAAGDQYTVGNTGGASTHTLTNAELPSHSHNYDMAATGVYNVASGYDSLLAQYDISTNTTSSTGLNKPHNNMPPYLVVNIWKRIQ